MSGTITVRPIEANLAHDKDIIGKMDPYCIVHLGKYNVKGQVCKSGGRRPQWGDTITVQRNGESNLLIELKDKDHFSRDDSLGACHIDLSSLPFNTPVRQWYPLHHWQRNVGEVFVELTFTPSMMGQQQMQYGGMTAMQSPFQISPYLGNHVAPTMAPQMGYQQPMMMQQQQQPVYQQPIMQQQQPVYQQPMMMQQQPVYQQPIMQQQQPVYQQPMMMQQQQQPFIQPTLQHPGAQYQAYQPTYGQPRYF